MVEHLVQEMLELIYQLESICISQIQMIGLNLHI